MVEFFSEPKVWVAIATLIFFAVAFKPAKKAILSAVDNRTVDITRNLQQAEQLKIEAQNLLAKIQQKHADAEKEAKSIIDYAKEEAGFIIAEAKQKLEKDIETRRKMALQKISSFEEAAIKEIKSHISNLTIEVSKKLLEDEIDGSSSKNIVSSSIDKLGKTLH